MMPVKWLLNRQLRNGAVVSPCCDKKRQILEKTPKKFVSKQALRQAKINGELFMQTRETEQWLKTIEKQTELHIAEIQSLKNSIGGVVILQLISVVLLTVILW